MSLRFAVVTGERLSRWQGDAVEKLRHAGAEFVACKTDPSVQAAPAPALLARIFPRTARVLAAALEPATMPAGSLADGERVDFVLAFDGAVWPAHLSAPLLGTWRVVPGTSAQWLAALAERAPTISIRVERSGEVLDEAVIATRPGSPSRALDSLLRRAIAGPEHALRKLQLSGPGVSFPVSAGQSNARDRSDPVLSLALEVAKARLRSIAENLFRTDSWRIGIPNFSPGGVPVAGTQRPPVRWLDLPRTDQFWADPFVLELGSRTYLLCEVFPFATQRGAIACVELRDGHLAGPVRTVLDRPYHLSYPFVIHDGERRYVVPESHEARCVLLYDVAEVAEWQQVATLIDDFAAVDSTIVFHAERWWLFCTDADADDNTDLHVWYADALTGPWTPHASNPVKRDVRSARSAGTPFLRDGILFRPAQDCSRGYGSRITINRVLDLTPTTFCEEPAAFIEPEPHGPCRYGMHTLALGNEICVIDGKEHRRDVRLTLAVAGLYFRRVRSALAARRSGAQA